MYWLEVDVCQKTKSQFANLKSFYEKKTPEEFLGKTDVDSFCTLTILTFASPSIKQHELAEVQKQ